MKKNKLIIILSTISIWCVLILIWVFIGRKSGSSNDPRSDDGYAEEAYDLAQEEKEYEKKYKTSLEYKHLLGIEEIVYTKKGDTIIYYVCADTLRRK